ncbi:MAG: Ig-like domain repeat protein, partial [Caldilinea sp.]|nr:Ig-like domain repeat protein [Caldilinea sp.]
TATTRIDGFTITAGNGGGLYCAGNGSGKVCSPTVSNVAFSGNVGGAMYNNGDRGTSSPSLTNVIFRGNSGSAMYNNGWYGVSSPSLVNVLFTGNSGRAMYNMAYQSSGRSSPSLVNVTFIGNSAEAMASAAVMGVSSPTLVNVIMWGNNAPSGAQMWNGPASPVISYSLIQGSGGSSNWDSYLGTDGGNNLDSDPIFVDAANGNSHLAAGSPAIDAGNNSAVPIGVTTDLDGSTRIQGAAVDIGAYEKAPQSMAVTLAKTVAQEADVANRATVTYTLMLENSGTIADSSVMLTDTLPAGASFAGWIEQPSGANFTGDALAWSGAVGQAEVITFTFIATNTASGGATITNTAWFSGSAQAGSDAAAYTTSSTLTPSGSGNWSEVYPPCSGVCNYVIPTGVTVTLDQDIELRGNLTIETGGTLIPNGKTVTLTGDQAQTLTGNPLIFYNLVVNKANKSDTVTIVGKLKVGKKLTVRSGKLISASDYGDIEIDVDGELVLTNTITISGNLIVSGTLTTNDNAITFDGGVDGGETVTQTLFLSDTTWFGDINVYTNTLLVEANPNDTVLFFSGGLTNYGTIRKTQPVDSAAPYYFGLAGIYPDVSAYGMEIEVTDLPVDDPLTAIQVDRIDHLHPNAPAGAGGPIYWNITPTGSNFTATVTLPYTATATPLACRYSGGVWACGNDESVGDPDWYVSKYGVTAFSDWAVLSCVPTISVQNANDSGAGSLRQAIDDVCDGGVITFSGSYTIYLDSTLAIDKSLTIDGSGQSVTVSGDSGNDGSKNVRVFSIDADAAVTLRRLNIVDGYGGDEWPSGGGIYNTGTLRLEYATVAHNTGGYGGGVINGGGGSSSGIMTVTNSSFISNTALSDGGGLYNSTGANMVWVENSLFVDNWAGMLGAGLVNEDSGTAVVINSTFVGNVTTGDAGGIFNNGTLTATNVSLVANQGNGGGIYNNPSGTLHMRNVLMAGSVGGVDCSSEEGVIAENSNNLVADGTCEAALSGEPLLGEFGDYGGDMQTVPLLPGSPAIDAGNGAVCPATDQRGVARPVGNGCDIGAFESRGFTLAKGTGDSQSTPWDMAFAAPITVAVSSAYTEPVDGGRVTYVGPLSSAGTAPITGTATITGGAASFTPTANITLGSYNVTASAAGASPAITFALTNTQRASATTLSSSANPSIVGQSVTFTATVTDDVGSVLPTGTVTFTVNGVDVVASLVSGVATYITDTLTVGSHVITATYGGDAGFLGSTDDLIQVVNQATSSTALTSGTNPSVFGQPVTYTATVSAVAPGAGTLTGVVTFTVNGAEVPVALVSGVASYVTDTLVAGSHMITATYGGDASFTGSVDDVTQVVNRTATATAITGAPASSEYGQSVTFTATVSAVAPGAGTPTGVVTFTVNGAEVTASLVGGAASYITDTLVVGSHVITATYGGDAGF